LFISIKYEYIASSLRFNKNAHQFGDRNLRNRSARFRYARPLDWYECAHVIPPVFLTKALVRLIPVVA